VFASLAFAPEVSGQEALAASVFVLAAFALEVSALSAVAQVALGPAVFGSGASGRTVPEQAQARLASWCQAFAVASVAASALASVAASATWQCRPLSSVAAATSCSEEVNAWY
jgi:hypothetical protein